MSTLAPTFSAFGLNIFAFQPLHSAPGKSGAYMIFTADKPLWHADHGAWLHSSSNVPFTWQQMTFPSVEHFYHSMKFYPHAPSVVNQIMSAPSPAEAVRIGQTCSSAPVRQDWDSVKDDIMMTAIRAKFGQHGDLGVALAALGPDARQYHGASNSYWAGKLGGMLATVADELRARFTPPENMLVRVKLSSSSTKIAGTPPGALGMRGAEPIGIYKWSFMGHLIGRMLSIARKQNMIGNFTFKINPDGPVYGYVFEESNEDGTPSGRYMTITAQTFPTMITGQQTRTSHQQAILEALSIIRVAIHKDKMLEWDPSATDLAEGQMFPAEAIAVEGGFSVTPMLAQDGENVANTIRECSTRGFLRNVYVQPKLDGMRMMFHREGADIVAHSRGGIRHAIAAEFVNEIAPIIHALETKHGAGIVLDGELYIHETPYSMLIAVGEKRPSKRTAAGKAFVPTYPFAGPLVPSQLNKITGAVKSYDGKDETVERNAPLVSVLEFHVFNFFHINKKSTYGERYNELREMVPMDVIGRSHWNRRTDGSWTRVGPRVLLVPMIPCGSQDDLERGLNFALDNNYEGVIVGNSMAPYQCKRTWDLIKIKPTETEWFQITGIVPEKSGLPMANLKYLHAGNEYVASGLFSDSEKQFFYANPHKVSGLWGNIRFQKITVGAASGGALRDPKILALATGPGAKGVTVKVPF